MINDFDKASEIKIWHSHFVEIPVLLLSLIDSVLHSLLLIFSALDHHMSLKENNNIDIGNITNRGFTIYNNIKV